MSDNKSAIIVVMVAICMIAVTVPAVIVASEDDGAYGVTIRDDSGKIDMANYVEQLNKQSKKAGIKEAWVLSNGKAVYTALDEIKSFTCMEFYSIMYPPLPETFNLVPDDTALQLDPIVDHLYWHIYERP